MPETTPVEVAEKLGKKYSPKILPVLREAFENNIDAVLFYNMDTNEIELVNERMTWISGYTEAELLGKSVDILVPQDKRSIHGETHRPSYRRNPRRRAMGESRDIQLQTKAGDLIPVLIDLSTKTLEDGRLVKATIRIKDA